MSHPLLPIGCYDLLPPHARQESLLSAGLLSVFEGYGYEQVAPPLLEYSDSLLAGRGVALSEQIFRVMDPHAHKVMGIRADMTLQIARIAATRMAQAPRPLRLCYNGIILRMQGEPLHGQRQLHQAGVELIGADSPQADAEVILVAAHALKRAGIGALSIDLTLPGITGSLLAGEAMDSERMQQVMDAIAHKDISTLRSLRLAHGDILITLVQSAGPAAAMMPLIAQLPLPEPAASQLNNLQAVLAMLQANGEAEWDFTIDITENRGLAYHSGISFSMFVPGAAVEVGRGGRYSIEGGEEATGFTLYVETLRHLLPPPAPPKRNSLLNLDTAFLPSP